MNDKLAKLQQKYAAALPEKQVQLRSAHEKAKGSPDPEPWKALKNLVHRLAGSAGAYGYPGLGKAARNADHLLAEALTMPDAPEPSSIDQAMAMLEKEFNQALQTPDPGNKVLSGTAAEEANSENAIPRLLLVDSNKDGRELKAKLDTFGYKTTLLPNPDDVLPLLHSQRYDAVLVDLMLPAGSDAGLALIRSVRQCVQGSQPVCVISAADSLDLRLRSANAGAAAYFAKPADIPALIATISDMISDSNTAPYRVMIIDDDDEHIAIMSEKLGQAGFDVHSASSLEGVLGELLQFNPELLLVDLNMPDYDGVDLTQVLRQHQNWFDLPIVIHSAEVSTEELKRALDAGADFCLPKDINDAELVESLRRRIRRLRRAQRMTTHDPLTGVLNRAAMEERIDSELARARRAQKSVCLAVLDIDRFKLVNDENGHLVGDMAIRHLATRIRQSLRRSDIVGRFGGDEIVVFLPDTRIADGQAVLEKAREDIESYPLPAGDKQIAITASIGITGRLISNDEEVEEIREQMFGRADGLLYEAKEGGRNRVCADSSATPSARNQGG